MKKKAQPKTSEKLSAAAWVLALATLALAIYQWVELAALRRGMKPACAINATFNCESVWNSPLADSLYGLTGVPVAGLGVVWGLAAAALAFTLWQRVRQGKEDGPFVFAVRVVAAIGLLATLVFAAESLRMGAVCITCVGTYALTGAFAIVAWFLSARPFKPLPFELREGLKWSVAALFVAYVAGLTASVMAPTRKVTQAELLARAESVEVQGAGTDDERKLEAYLKGLGADQRQALSDLLEEYRLSRPKGTLPAPRTVWGPADAPVKIVDFTDIRCGHCGNLSATLQVLKRVAPPGALSIEPRYYPLDAECNPGMKGSDKTGVRCLGAKVQLCLEPAPDFWTLREKLFEAQHALTTPEKVMDIASSGSVSRQALEACVQSPETAKKLSEDLAFAESQGITGTPLVLVNGKQAPPLGPLLYALALTRGNADAAIFKSLPAPKPHDHSAH